MRAGYACICLEREGLRCQRSTVLRNADPERLRELIEANLQGLEEILRFNEAREMRLFRLGNSFIPFASHPVNEVPWWEEFGERFREIGAWARARGHRLSFHASHFTILNSENPAVVESSLRDVEYYCRVLEAMELGPEHKVILHGGVLSPDPETALDRLERGLERVPSQYRRHLVLENDERFFELERMLALSRRVGQPVVIDVLHHAVKPGSWAGVPAAELLERTFRTWGPEDGPPKVHFSTQDPEKKAGAHGYWADPEEVRTFLRETRIVARDFDIMFEAKGKDLAVTAVLPILREDPRWTA
jgi:UV DNA damage endonuclease